MCSWLSYFLRMLHVTYSLQTFNGIISCTISALVLVGVIIITLETCKLLFLTRYHLPDYSFEIYLSQCISISFVTHYMNQSTSNTMFTIANFQCFFYSAVSYTHRGSLSMNVLRLLMKNWEVRKINWKCLKEMRA